MSDSRATELIMDPASLYREEVFTDRKVGTIRQLTPVKSNGAADATRPVLFVGEASLLTPMGTLPISFEIDGTSLGEAVQNYADAAKVAVERTVRELQDLRRQAASSIVIPETGNLGALGGPGPMPPRPGRIQLP